jgi:DnaJ-class molecular chaperone
MMRAEVKADCYGGDTFDQVTKHFNVYCEGDKQDDTSNDDIVIALKDLPPGARIEIRYPACPSCGASRGDMVEAGKIVGHDAKCFTCGFDWEAWVIDTFS